MSPVVIILVSDGSRCLLARQPSFPEGMYTALSGFCDLGKVVSDPAWWPRTCRPWGQSDGTSSKCLFTEDDGNIGGIREKHTGSK